PGEPEVFLFPAIIPGFDLCEKKWKEIEVDKIHDVVWNDNAFRHLVADEDVKERIEAAVRKQLETRTDHINNKGKGLIMLLHGPPGTGKTFTAQSVRLGSKWNCIMLLEGADIFIQQRQRRDTLVSIFRNRLEYEDGILVLTANSDIAFDETVTSHIKI
ncbi:uncharacterized protein B0I36DRAFT_218350, partial [Microdochium trichocladiopsis]